MIYQVCGSDSGVESTAARGWPMLNSILTGPVSQILKRRDLYLDALRRHGRSETEIAGLMKHWGVSRQIYVAPTDAQALEESKDAEMWYQDSLRRFQVPERIEDAHPSLQAGFRAAAERFAKSGARRETFAFGSPDTVAGIGDAGHGRGTDPLLDELQGLPSR
jgi:alkanesulfonate monooxygenase SsuD/methylene tetrahydromethanopterin reductase-like flavin-dependent oxidoreductase (luciferase family)